MSDSKYADLRTRTISAIVMLIIACVTLGVGGILFQLTLLAVGFCVMWEIVGFSPSQSAYRAAISVMFACSIAAGIWFIWPISVGMLIATLSGYILLTKPSDQVLRCVLAILAFMGLITLANLRLDVGLAPTLWVIACVIASDIGGYFAGRTFGGPKLWPAISPKKTWSGTIGGWVLAIVVTLVFLFATDALGWSALIWSFVIAMFAQAGDLFESALKRRAGVKDSSNLIPGHGGFLDRFDGMLGAFFLLSLLALFNVQGWLF